MIIPRIDMFKWGYRDSHIIAARWLREHSDPDDKIFVLLDVGIIGRWSERYIIDWGKLVTPWISKYPDVESAVRDLHPTYFVHTQRTRPLEALEKYPSLPLVPVMEFVMPPTGVSKTQFAYTAIYRLGR